MSESPFRVVVVDDDPLVCAHLRTILQTADDIQVIDVAHDGAAGVESVVRHRPDLVLMDLRMPGVDGLAATARIAALPKPPAIVALTTFDADRYVLAALRAGAAGYLLKSTPPRDLIGLVRAAAAGHTVLPPGATRGLLAGTARAVLPEGLTERDTEVLTGLAKGLSNAQIGVQLHLTEATVKGYVSRVLTKLGCANRTQAGLLAQQAGLSSGNPDQSIAQPQTPRQRPTEEVNPPHRE
jgi:DNA-binding NarL/FixJ family response regulator